MDKEITTTEDQIFTCEEKKIKTLGLKEGGLFPREVTKDCTDEALRPPEAVPTPLVLGSWWLKPPSDANDKKRYFNNIAMVMAKLRSKITQKQIMMPVFIADVLTCVGYSIDDHGRYRVAMRTEDLKKAGLIGSALRGHLWAWIIENKDDILS